MNILDNIKRYITAALIALVLTSMLAPVAMAADADAAVPDQGLARLEELLYGSAMSGGLFLRLSKVESDLFGMELPGSLTERMQAMQMFVEEGSASQPSLLFKMGVAEWVTFHRTNAIKPMTERVSSLETTLEGSAQSGAISARVERLIAKLLPGGATATKVQIPAATVVKAEFTETVSVRNVEKGSILGLDVLEDIVLGGTLAIPKGSRLFAEVTKVQPPRSFGRSSEIAFDLRSVETLSGKRLPVSVDVEAQKAQEMDSGVIGAAGASLAGAIALGPLGLAGGFLVRGNDKQIPAGTHVYVQTMEYADVDGYAVPNLSVPTTDASSGGGSDQTSTYQDNSASTSDTTVY